MHVITARNVNDAYTKGMTYLLEHGEREPSRDGPVLASPVPVTTVYERPWERVLMDPVRDANPFFHLMESVWMLAGRRDPQWLDRYVKNFSARFAEEGGEQHGAYGYRWQRHFVRGDEEVSMPDVRRLDQLRQVAEMLRRDPTTRRAVLTMWDPVVDLNLPSRDLPCNTHVYFRARPLKYRDGYDGPHTLDITVLCRSNDAIMGAYGANAVHMSIMGEVVAGLAGMLPGTYRQVSNNFHAYERDLAKFARGCEDDEEISYDRGDVVHQSICGEDGIRPTQIMEEAEAVVADCRAFCDAVAEGTLDGLSEYASSRWFQATVIPMQRAHDRWRQGGSWRTFGMGEMVASMPARSDWARAAIGWMERRTVK